jgi:hypothetical protein
VYSFPDAKLQGTLTGLSFPAGECVDTAGDVWIVEEGPNDIVEYAHGGTIPIATLTDPNNAPEACAVDPKTGNLAVANAQTLSAGPGSVGVYAHAQGAPTLYTDSQMKFVPFVTYDDKGNLYADGVDSSLAYQLAEVRKNAGALTPIAFNQGIVQATNIHQFFIQGDTFIGPNLGNENVMFWKYPAGGAPTKAIGGFNDPFGSAVSKGKK